MKTYNVVFHYSVEVTAENEETAEDQAWSLFGAADPTVADHFSCSVDEKEEY